MLLGFLVGFPAGVAIAMLLIRDERVRNTVVKLAAGIVALAALATAATYFGPVSTRFRIGSEAFSTVLLIAECAMCALIVVLCARARRWFTALLSLVQTGLIVWFETTQGHFMYVLTDVLIDKFTILMILIIGLIGSAITVYALGYMRDFHHHDRALPDRRPFFFFVMYIFLAAMFGLVLSNNLMMLYFCWEITSFCSFLLIGYTGAKEAKRNSFCALNLNLLEIGRAHV